MREDTGGTSSESIYRTKREKAHDLLQSVADSSDSNFYRHIWAKGALAHDETDLDTLPSLTKADIVRCPFDDRLYLKERLFVKIVTTGTTSFLIARTKSDIEKEHFGDVGFERPLVIFENPHESIEKGLWLYGKHILPLVAEDNLTITLLAAQRYDIDSIVCDEASLQKIAHHNTRDVDYRNITAVTVIDSRFDQSFYEIIPQTFPNANIQLILSLPETGPLAYACTQSDSGELLFHPVENALLDISADGGLIATRLILLPTPILKYGTGLKARMHIKECICTSESCFTLLTT